MSKLILNMKDYFFKQGDYGRVFFKKDNIDNVAIKVFFNSADKPTDHIEKTFNSEVDAYEIIQKNKDLSKFIPKFYGKVLVDKIISEDGEDISSNYFLNYAYKMEYIEGVFDKYGSNYNKCNILKSFIEAGVHDVADCSAILDNDGKPTKIVDFATEKFDLEH